MAGYSQRYKQSPVPVIKRLMEVVINVARPACRCQIPDTLIACLKRDGNYKSDGQVKVKPN